MINSFYHMLLDHHTLHSCNDAFIFMTCLIERMEAYHTSIHVAWHDVRVTCVSYDHESWAKLRGTRNDLEIGI